MKPALMLLHIALLLGVFEAAWVLVQGLHAVTEGPYEDEEGDTYVPSMWPIAYSTTSLVLFGTCYMLVLTGEV